MKLGEPSKFLECLRANKGELIRLKRPLYWYAGGKDSVVNRVCILVDADPDETRPPEALSSADACAGTRPTAAALLFFGDSLHWVWVNENVLEIL